MSFPLWFSPPDRDAGRLPGRRLALVSQDSTPANRIDPEDHALIARIRAGDETAFAELFHMYYPRLVGYAGSLLANVDEADDLVCELFTQLFVAHANFAPGGPVRAYLFHSVRNRVLNVQRGRYSANRYVQIMQEHRRNTPASDTEAHVRAGDNPVVLAAIEAAFATLPPRAREAASLRWRQGMALDDIAATLGIAKTSVTMLLSRTLKALRRELAPLRQYVSDE